MAAGHGLRFARATHLTSQATSLGRPSHQGVPHRQCFARPASDLAARPSGGAQRASRAGVLPGLSFLDFPLCAVRDSHSQ